MKNKLVSQLTQYYLRYDKENPFIYLSILLSFLGISLGVMALIISMGVMNGTQKELTKKLTTMKYPITITSQIQNRIDDDLVLKLNKKFPSFKISPYYETKAIIQDGDEINAVLLYGVDFKKESEINNIFKDAVGKGEGKFKVIIGVGFSNSFGYFDGDKIELMFPKMETLGFASAPIKKRFLIDGTFKSGLGAYDIGVMYTTIDAMKRILQKNYFDGVHVSSLNAMEDIKKIRNFLNDEYDIIGWWERDSELYSALKTEKTALFLVLMIIILVASLNIISSLLMMVITKRKDIALLISLGSTKKEIKNIFFRLGLTVGMAGIIFGLILGAIGLWVLSFWKLSESIYGFSKLPIELPLFDLGLIILGTITIVFLSSIYPAKKAAETDVLKVLRND